MGLRLPDLGQLGRDAARLFRANPTRLAFIALLGWVVVAVPLLVCSRPEPTQARHRAMGETIVTLSGLRKEAQRALQQCSEEKARLFQRRNELDQHLFAISDALRVASSLVAAARLETEANRLATQRELDRLDFDLAERAAALAGMLASRTRAESRLETDSREIERLELRVAASRHGNRLVGGRLKHMKAEVAALESAFHSLAALQSQKTRLKEQLAVEKRRAWLRKGLYAQRDQKPAQAHTQLDRATADRFPPRQQRRSAT
jgi:chromosome segregation ATPase